MTDEVGVVVAVDDDHTDDLAEVVAHLRTAGMRVTEVQQQLGTVTGRLDEAKLDALRAVEGVQHVDRSQEIQLPPPDSDVQ